MAVLIFPSTPCLATVHKELKPTSLKAISGCFPLTRLSLLEAGHKVQKQGYSTLPFPRTPESWALCPSLCSVNLDQCLSVTKSRFFHTHLILPFQTRNTCQSMPCKDTAQEFEGGREERKYSYTDTSLPLFSGTQRHYLAC